MRVKIPVLIDKRKVNVTDLKLYGDVKETDGFYELEYICHCSYFGDDETVVYSFWHTVTSGLNLDHGDYSFVWDRMEIFNSLPG